MSRDFGKETRRSLIAEIHGELRGLHAAVDAINQAVADRLGINRTDLRCLDILQRHGPMTAGHLAEAAGLTTSAVTTVLDRLEQAGYARRVRDAADRRRVLVEMTPKMHRIGEQIYGQLVAATDMGLDQYTTEELLLIRDFVRRGRQITATHAARMQARTAGTDPDAE